MRAQALDLGAGHAAAVARVADGLELARAVPAAQRVDADADGAGGVAERQRAVVVRHGTHRTGNLPDMEIRTAVVGHVEWATFVRVPHMPVAGDLVHVSEIWEEPGGGGGVAAVQLVKLAGTCTFLTALAKDGLGRRSTEVLAERGVEVHAAPRPAPQRRVFVHVDDEGERTITVIGGRIVPHGDDDLPWGALDGADACYFTGGDAAALRAARRARILVATPRAAATLHEAGVQLDALVHSGTDKGERLEEELDPAPKLVVTTLGAAAGAGRPPRGAPAPGRRRSSKARASTPTAPATRSPPG